jgi:mannose-6-phosphate isomerase-like protein (cupin superfamily)
MPPVVFPGRPSGSATRSRVLVPPSDAGWAGIVMTEWELTAQEWIDEHPHDEFNFVLEGTLVVECDGETVEVGAGQVVQVPAGSRGRYRAPQHARMLAVYGPNPDGARSTIVGLRALDDSG